MTVLRRSVMRRLGNPKVSRFLCNRYAEIHAEMSAIIASETIG